MRIQIPARATWASLPRRPVAPARRPCSWTRRRAWPQGVTGAAVRAVRERTAPQDRGRPAHSRSSEVPRPGRARVASHVPGERGQAGAGRKSLSAWWGWEAADGRLERLGGAQTGGVIEMTAHDHEPDR
jgi:hypothetical protein